MKIAASTEDETIAALDQMKRSVRMAFCGVMQSTQLPPMAAMSLAATAVGLLYHEVAAAHRGDNACPCGWEPRSAADVAALQTSLALAAEQQPAPISAQWRSPATPEDDKLGGRRDWGAFADDQRQLVDQS